MKLARSFIVEIHKNSISSSVISQPLIFFVIAMFLSLNLVASIAMSFKNPIVASSEWECETRNLFHF